MKKIFVFILVCVFTLSLVSCSSRTSKSNSTSESYVESINESEPISEPDESHIATEEEWARLVTIVDNYKAYYNVVVDGESAEEIFTCINGVLCVEMTGKNPEYFAEEEGKYYRYYMDETTWVKKEIDQNEYFGISNSNNVAPIFTLAEMTYMSKEGFDIYYCANKNWYGATYTNTSIIFQNGQFVGFSCTQTVPLGEGEFLTVEMVATFTFEDLGEIVLPNVA